MTPHSQVRNWTLNTAQAAALMVRLGEPGPLAPLCTVAGDERAAALPGGIDEAAVACLASPSISLRIKIVSASNGRELHAYGGHGSRHLVGFTAMEESRYNLSYPLDPDHATALLTTSLGLDQDIGELTVSTQLSGAGLVSLGGLVDALRQRDLENLLARLPRHEGGVTEEEVYLRALDGTVSADARWTSALLASVVDDLPDVGEKEITGGLRALQGVGWATPSRGGNWGPSAIFSTAASHLQLPLAGAKVSVSRLTDGRISTTSFALLRMLGSMWLCHPKAGNFDFASVSAKSALAHLTRIFEGIAAFASTADKGRAAVAKDTVQRGIAPNAAKPQTEHTTPQPRTGAGRVSTDRFCTGCGKPLVVGVRFCSHCGKAAA